jgi:hypothetical protein
MLNESNKGHRWSGWPGAWCLDCGVADPFEEAISNPDITRLTKDIFKDFPRDCPCPGSNNHNPYVTRQEVKDILQTYLDSITHQLKELDNGRK